MADRLNIPGIDLQPGRVDPRQMRGPLPQRSPEAGGASFQDVLKDAVTEVQQLQNQADNTIKQVVSGEITDVSEAMVAVQQADVQFQTLMTVRNKVMTAYQEIIRMQV